MLLVPYVSKNFWDIGIRQPDCFDGLLGLQEQLTSIPVALGTQLR